MHFGSLLSDYNSKEEQGDFGEFKVKNKILRIRDKLGECYLYRDVYIESNNHVYQIDHVLICSKGIFVIETKAVSGKVIGNVSIKYWTSYVYGKKTEFFNPITQNAIHIKAMKYYFGEDFPYFSIVVFSENNKPNNLPNNVLNLKELQDYLLSFESDISLSGVQINYFKTNLEDLIKNKNALRHKHKEQVKYKTII